MEIFRLLQIGDVHYPDPANSTPAIDHKDRGFPDRISGDIGQAPLQAVCRRVSRLIEEIDLDAIAFMGDFTDRGHLPSLKACAEYLYLQIPLSWASKVATQTVTCIGNHDIARATATEASQRFADVNSLLTAAGFPAASVTTPTELLWKSNLAEVRIYGINTCIGCGETRFLPPIIRPTVMDALQELIANGAPDILEQLIESIDTPVIADDTIFQLRNRIEKPEHKPLILSAAITTFFHKILLASPLIPNCSMPDHFETRFFHLKSRLSICTVMCMTIPTKQSALR